MKRQASSQQTLAGFDINDFDDAFPENTGRYVAPRYVERAVSSPAKAGPSPLIETHPLQESAVLVLLGLIRAGHSLSVAASWGKDSANCVLLLIEAVRRAVAEGINTLHFITTSSTGTEMPLMEMHAVRCQDEVMKHCDEHRLPIEVHTVYPSLASSFIVSTIGRGTLPRFPENGKKRTCSVDWKASPQQRLVTELNERVLGENGREIITIIGTRLEESVSRAERMIARRESSTTPVRNKDGFLVLSVISHWTLDDVWNTIEMIADSESSPYVPPISADSVRRLFKLYRDANEGVCGISLGDKGNKSPCGPRFGCWNCTIAGAKDKSMDSLLKDESNAFMRPLSDFRNYLMATQFDFDTRELMGRKVSPAGYVQVRPDVYSFEFRLELLWYLLSMDADERDRAEKMEEDIACGLVEDTPDNRAMASPAFENVSLSQLSLVDFFWGMHPYASSAFPALQIWYEVNVLGRRRRVSKHARAPKISVPTKRWFKVGQFDHDALPSEGLRSYENELWNKHRHPGRPATYCEVDGERTVWFDQDDNLTVDAFEACAFITCTFPEMVIDVRSLPAIESTRFWLNEGIIKLPRGQGARYQAIAKRGQYFYNVALKLNLAPHEFDRYVVENSISNVEHEKLVPAPRQPDLFAPQLAA
jgi:DNA sulfur modification protein DndC